MDTKTTPVEQLLSILDLQMIDQNRYEGQSGNSLWQRVFGGHVIAQALTAAQRTVEGRYVHSLHAYFMRPGNPDYPIIYEVERLRDGRSFSTRRVVASQLDKPIFTLSASFQVDEDGLDYERPFPADTPPPEEIAYTEHHALDQAPEMVRHYWNLHRPFLIRPVDLENYLQRKNKQPYQKSWFRLDGSIVENRVLNAAILAYLSDMTLLDTSLFVHGKSVFSPEVQPASLDHAMWFHRPFKLDDWLLYELESPSTSGARGFSRGFIYTRDGTLVASVAQEGLMRIIGD